MNGVSNRQTSFVLAAAFALLGSAVCSRQNDAPATASTTAAIPSETPAAPPDANLAAADMGGAVEEVTGSYGPGFTGRRLIDGLLDPPWRIEEPKPGYELKYPQEALISFFERHSAEIKTVTVVLPESATYAPKDVEVWTSMDASEGSFTRVATAALRAISGEQAITFTPLEARFVKVRILSGMHPKAIEIAELRVIEASRRGYTPLFARAPTVRFWKGSPREAAQRGLDWLQHAGATWITKNGCFGCHVQSQVLMGQTVAVKHGYRVNMRAMRALFDHAKGQANWGSWWNPPYSATAFGAMGITHAMEVLGADEDRKYPYTELGFQAQISKVLVERQLKDGSMPVDEVNPPIVQGRFMTTANSVVALVRTAANNKADEKSARAAERALAWIAATGPETTQDKIFKIIALMQYGTPDQKRTAWSVVETLAAEQETDGGWKEHATSAGSNAIAAGMVLYAFKQAGVSIHGDMFKRGVHFLLTHQENKPTPENGSWAATNTDSHQPSAFAHTMWAVIGLAGSYGAEPTGALQIVRQVGDKPPTRNLEIVLDVSGSMNATLGATTRWHTALDVLKQVVGELPEDMNVGMRVYGHRESPQSSRTCADTQLIVPIAKLDRQRILDAASKLRPRGETPLIRSVLATMDDLNAAGGGSVILITDGEESCKGDARTAAATLKSSGLNLTLNIVGFTITGEATQAELGTLAGSTGGRYYSAQNGAQLARAVMLAALHRLPYDILDQAGNVLVSGLTSELSRELPPGTYRLRVNALGQVLEEPLTIVPNQTTKLALGVEGDRFVIRR